MRRTGTLPPTLHFPSLSSEGVKEKLSQVIRFGSSIISFLVSTGLRNVCRCYHVPQGPTARRTAPGNHWPFTPRPERTNAEPYLHSSGSPLARPRPAWGYMKTLRLQAQGHNACCETPPGGHGQGRGSLGRVLTPNRPTQQRKQATGENNERGKSRRKTGKQAKGP